MLSNISLSHCHSLIKLSLFLLLWAIAWLPISIYIYKRLQINLQEGLKSEQKLPLVGSLYVIAPIGIGLISKLEGVSWGDYGLNCNQHLWVSLLWGLGLSMGGLGLIFALEGLFGWIEWHPDNMKKLWSVFLPILLLGLWLGGTEELIFRGLFINELKQDYSFWVAGVISSVIFALLHLVWEQKQTIPQLPGLWLMGMVLVWARLVDGGSLGLAWGLHAGWIWGLASLDTTQLISYTEKGSPWLIGFNQQPLAGAAGIVCLLLTGVVLFWF